MRGSVTSEQQPSRGPAAKSCDISGAVMPQSVSRCLNFERLKFRRFGFASPFDAAALEC
jgi:hypothetical protein